MIVLIAAVIGGGLVTAVILVPISPLAALVATPIVASFLTVLAGFFLAWQRSRKAATASIPDMRAGTGLPTSSTGGNDSTTTAASAGNRQAA